MSNYSNINTYQIDWWGNSDVALDGAGLAKDVFARFIHQLLCVT
jgi:hypothetical protein